MGDLQQVLWEMDAGIEKLIPLCIHSSLECLSSINCENDSLHCFKSRFYRFVGRRFPIKSQELCHRLD